MYERWTAGGGERVGKWHKDKFRSSEFRKLGKSRWHFVSGTPIIGLLKPGQARKTAGHNTAGKCNREADWNFHSTCPFDCWEYIQIFSSLPENAVRREADGQQTVKTKSFTSGGKERSFTLLYRDEKISGLYTKCEATMSSRLTGSDQTLSKVKNIRQLAIVKLTNKHESGLFNLEISWHTTHHKQWFVFFPHFLNGLNKQDTTCFMCAVR